MININSIKSDKKLIKKFIPIATILIFIGVSTYLAYNHYQTQKELSEYRQGSDVLAIKEKNELIKKLNKIALLPQDEEPTIATVADAFRLRDQKFFTQAENGDKVIIYSKAQRAILYRPSTGKIIESAPVNISDLEGSVNNTNLGDVPESTSSSYVLGEEAQDQELQPLTKKEPASLAIYNGTLYIEGLATKVGAYLVKEIPGDEISVDILKNTDKSFEETVVIKITDNYSEIADTITSLLDAQTQERQNDVNYPEVDIVIIVGLDLASKNLE